MDTKKPLHLQQVIDVLHRLALSDTHAAEYLGVPISTVRKWRRGERVPSAAVARLLDVLALVETLAPEIHAHLLPTDKRKKG